jgi:hypothetical protein
MPKKAQFTQELTSDSVEQKKFLSGIVLIQYEKTSNRVKKKYIHYVAKHLSLKDTIIYNMYLKKWLSTIDDSYPKYSVDFFIE